MIIQTGQAKINVELFPSSERESTFVFLLHGFTGSASDWEAVIPLLPKKFSYAAVDLIGHGKSESPENIELYSANSLAQQLDKVFNQLTKKKFIVLGYSMGGRAALTYAVHHPEKLSGLILESASAGTAYEKLREERRQSDAKIIKLIEEKPLEEFIDYWINQDLFATLKTFPAEKLAKIQNSKFKIQKIGLINSLKGFGTGVMPALYNEIHLITSKTLLITGELDTKFTKINSELVELFPKAEHVIVKNTGHNVHLEKPEEYVGLTNGFLSQF